jgi:hypothetical protein
MKKLIVIAFVCLIAGQAHATKSRVQSLLGAVHLVDSQTIFVHPEYVSELGQYLTLEMGPSGQNVSSGTTAQAEGGLFRKVDDSVMGLYLGHHDTFQTNVRNLAGAQLQTNPLNFFYGKSNWGATLGISNTDFQTTQSKETTFYGGFGMDMGDLNWSVNAELIANASTTTGGVETKYTGAPELSFDLLKDTGTWVWNGNITYGSTKSETGGTATNRKDMILQAGGIDRSFKNNERDLYWGIFLSYNDRDIEGRHLTVLQLPVVVGLEYALNSWATFRTSILQNFLLGSSKTDAPAPATTSTTDTIANNTTVAAGIGVKHSNLTVDASFAAATAAAAGAINTVNFLTNAGLTYSF